MRYYYSSSWKATVARSKSMVVTIAHWPMADDVVADGGSVGSMRVSPTPNGGLDLVVESTDETSDGALEPVAVGMKLGTWDGIADGV